MSATFQVNEARWKQAVGDLQNLVSNSASAVVKQQARLLVKDLMQQTPPFFTSQKLMPGVTSDLGDNPSDRKVGERAVRKDFARLFKPMSGNYVRAAIEKHGNPIVNCWLTIRGGRRMKIDGVRAGLSVAEAKSFHRSRWAYNSLKVSRPTEEEFATRDQMILPFEVYAEFLAEELARVGSQKAGWAFAADNLGQKVPSWIAKNKRSQGRVITPLTAGIHPAFRFGNSARGIKRIEHIVGKALRDRAAKIEADIKRRVQYGPGKRGFHFIEGIE